MREPRNSDAWTAPPLALPCIVAFGLVAACTPSPPSPPRPNVVLMIADDLGYAELGCTGSTAVATPHIDSLSAAGTLFTHAYATSATCSPSRAAMLTGRYQQRTGVEFALFINRSQHGLNADERTLANYFGEAGYRTGLVGKWHLGTRPGSLPLERGFDEFFGFLPGAYMYAPGVDGGHWLSTVMRGSEQRVEADYMTEMLAREAVSFIDRHAAEAFFLCLSFDAVHSPVRTDPEYAARYPEVEDPLQRDYYGMISALDDAVGAVLGRIEHHGLVDRTLVAWVNDNGAPAFAEYATDNGPFRLGKMFLFDGGVRVPLIVRWPGVALPGGRCDRMVSTLDLLPTLTAAAGVTLPGALQLDGADLGPLLRDPVAAPAQERTLFWRNGPNHAACDGRWKLIAAGEHEWLFDLDADPGEERNVIAEHGARATALRQAYAAWNAELPPAGRSARPLGPRMIDGVPYEMQP